jgi:hypothetical protein
MTIGTVGVGTTSVPKTSDEENSLIKSALGLTRGEISSQGIIKSLKEDRESKINQRNATKDLLLLTDVTIDGYDKLIVNMDKPLPDLITDINEKITAVKTAYDARISVNCLSDLKWIKIAEETRKVSFFNTGTYGKGGALGSINVVYQTWQVKKDPDQYRQINYYGAKYYRRPHNRDYGANLVKELEDVSVGIGSTYIIVFGDLNTALYNLRVNDTVTDSLENPTVFQIGNLPEIVGFGSTAVVGPSTTFTGSISLGSTVLLHTGVGIVTVGIATGDRIIRVGVTSSDTVVVGFGTTSTQIEIIDDEGDPGITTTTVNTIILSKPAIATTSLGEFTVGISTVYPTIFISTTTSSYIDHGRLIVIRPDEDVTNNFNPNLNGTNPVEISLLKNSNKLGYGHTLQIINNGSPDITAQWRDVIDPEPAVGAGFAPYYVGAASWPCQLIPVYSYGGIGGTIRSIVGYTTVYRPEGYTVVIGLGLTTPQPVLNTTSVKPPGAPSDSTCTNTYTANITAAETQLGITSASVLPKLNYYANASDTLRDVRDEKESRAFSLQRGIGFLTQEINTLKTQIDILEAVDFTEFE